MKIFKIAEEVAILDTDRNKMILVILNLHVAPMPPTKSWLIPTLVEKNNVSLKTLLQQGISEPEFYGDLVYRFRKIVGKSNFSEQFRKLIGRYKRIGYSLDIMRQTACLVINPILVDGYASLFNCTTAIRASDPMTASS